MLTDREIAELLSERKVLPKAAVKRLQQLAPHHGGDFRAEIRCKGASGRKFSIWVSRQPVDMHFSVHVRYYPAGTRKFITLARCNGHHAPHTNIIEKKLKQGIVAFPGNTCHIHRLTERYQQLNLEKDLMYAEPTDHYHDLASAIEYVCYSFGFCVKGDPYDEPFPLFKEVSE